MKSVRFGQKKKEKPPMKLALDAVNIILPCSQWEAAEMCFLQSGPIWMGCSAADCAALVIHRGTLTACSGERYLNQKAPTWVVREESGRGTVSMLAKRQKGDGAFRSFLISTTPETVCSASNACMSDWPCISFDPAERSASRCAFFPSLLWWLSPQNLPSA